MDHSLHLVVPQKFGIRLCQLAAVGASIGFIALLALNAKSPANADGVVVKSLAPNYAKGDIIQDGQSVSLGPDESITVLNPAGDMITLTESSIFGQTGPAQRRSISAWDAATWNERRTAIGGTRTQSYEECVVLAETRSDITGEICARIHLEDAEDEPALDMKLLGNPSKTRAGQPIKLSLQTNFEAEVSCELRDGTGSKYPLLLGKTNTGTVHLMNGTRTHLPRRGGTPIAAPQTAGSYTIACVAIQSQAVEIANEATEAEEGSDAERDIAVKFAEISGAPLARAEIDLTIID